MNEKQQIAFDLVTGEQKNVFITGSAGVGKSFLIKHIKEWAIAHGKKVMVTATTGVAAANVNGTTFHGWAGIGLGKSKKENMTQDEMEFELKKRAYYLRRNDAALTRYTTTDILIIDEVSMLDYRFMAKVNSIAKILRKCSKPFGGIQLVLTGDFYQLGPIQRDRKNAKFIFEDNIWDELVDESVHLTEVYRQRSSDFVSMLHKIREGDVDGDIEKRLQESASHRFENELGIIPTVLFCKNVNVDAMNARGLSRLEGKEHKFSAIDTFASDTTKELYEGSFTYPNSLVLKVGAQVMLIKNLDIEKKLVNGARGVVTAITEDDPIHCPGGQVVVKFLDGSQHAIKPDTQKFTKDPSHEENSRGDSAVLAQRIQYPLKLAYALTVHKSQGLSIDYLHVDLRGAFTAGQAYVALSRATSFDNLRVTNFSRRCVITSEQVQTFYRTLGARKRSRPLDQIRTYFAPAAKKVANSK